MGILNIDEHVEEHRLMAIRYPDKAVIPGQSVIAQSNIPFLIMPGDGGANGCSFSGTAGAFTLSAAIIANIGTALAGCYAYFSANFGGSTLPAGWYWTEFSSDTDGIVYVNTYSGGQPRRPASNTPFAVNLSGRITATTNEVVGPFAMTCPAGALGKNGTLTVFMRQVSATGGTKIFRAKLGAETIASTGSGGSPVVETQHTVVCADSHTVKLLGRTSTSGGLTGLGAAASAYVTTNVISGPDTSADTEISFSIQGAALSGTVLLSAMATAVFGA